MSISVGFMPWRTRTVTCLHFRCKLTAVCLANRLHQSVSVSAFMLLSSCRSCCDRAFPPRGAECVQTLVSDVIPSSQLQTCLFMLRMGLMWASRCTLQVWAKRLLVCFAFWDVAGYQYGLAASCETSVMLRNTAASSCLGLSRLKTRRREQTR